MEGDGLDEFAPLDAPGEKPLPEGAVDELEQTLETETDINRKVDKLGKNLSRMIRNLSGLSLAGLNRGDGPLNNIGKIKSLIS